MGKSQQSKRARKTRKQAKAAGLPTSLAHPSHAAGVARFIRVWDKRRNSARKNTTY